MKYRNHMKLLLQPRKPHKKLQTPSKYQKIIWKILIYTEITESTTNHNKYPKNIEYIKNIQIISNWSFQHIFA